MKLWAGLILWCFSYLASADSLRIVSSEFIPHNGEHLPNQGYAIQMLREIFASQQQEVHFEFLPWPRALLQAKEGGSSSYCYYLVQRRASKVSELPYAFVFQQSHVVSQQTTPYSLYPTGSTTSNQAQIRYGPWLQLSRGYRATSF